MTGHSGRTLGTGASGPGIVHLGAGAFARAHTWWATALAVDADPGPWGVTAVAQRSHAVIDALLARDWRYDVRLLGPDEDSTDTVAVVRDGLVAADEPDRLMQALSAPETRIVTVTATEEAYPTTSTGTLDARNQLVAADLRGDAPPRSLVGQVVAAAALRQERGAPPLSVLVCDNVQRGGEVLRQLATQLAEERGLGDAVAELARWRFPTSVVDRVVPAVEPEQQPDVVADPAFRWVLQDDFAGPRPAWERAGVQIVHDAEPWQLGKLLLVNAPHSLVAYLGLALGHTSVGEAMGDDVVSEAVGAALADELVPCVPAAAGLDPGAEAAATVRRFTRQVLPHALKQVGAAGSTKLPQRLRFPLDRHRVRETAGTWSTLTIALWVHALDRALVEDSCADRVRASIGSSPAQRAIDVIDLLGLGSAEADPARDGLAGWLTELDGGGPEAVRGAVVAATR